MKELILKILAETKDLKLDESAPTRTIFMKTPDGNQIFPIEIPVQLTKYLPAWSFVEIKDQDPKFYE